jgi:purine nucleoside phosphorylase
MCSKTKDEVIKDLNKKKEKGEYLVIGSDNFWYGSGFNTLKEAEEVVKEAKKNISNYGNPESHDTQSEVPNSFYIYKASLVKEI